MAFAFSPIPAKPAFGNLKDNGFQSDYIANKKAKLIYCKERLYCNKLLRASSYDQKSLFNRGLNIKNLGNCTLLPFNKSNLIVQHEFQCLLRNKKQQAHLQLDIF
jgi:hypothetical protein